MASKKKRKKHGDGVIVSMNLEIDGKDVRVAIITTRARGEAITKALDRQKKIKDNLRETVLALPSAGQEAFLNLAENKLDPLTAILEGMNTP